jgi:hypothetical protein
VRVVGRHRRCKQVARRAIRPRGVVAEAGVDLDHARALAARPSAVDEHRAACPDGLAVVRRGERRPHARVEAVPDGNGQFGPVDKVLRDEVAVVGPVAGRGGDVKLVEVVEHAVDRIEEGPVRVVLRAAVLAHKVECRRIVERLAAKLVSGVARAVEARDARHRRCRREQHCCHRPPSIPVRREHVKLGRTTTLSKRVDKIANTKLPPTKLREKDR